MWILPLSPRSLTFIFGNHAEAQSGDYFLEGCRNKQPASKPAAQKKTGGCTGRVPGMLLGPDRGCGAQTGLSVLPICPVWGGGYTVLPFCKGSQGGGTPPAQALELRKEMGSHHFRTKWKILDTLPTRQDARSTQGDKWGPTDTGPCACPPGRPPPTEDAQVQMSLSLVAGPQQNLGLARGTG